MAVSYHTHKCTQCAGRMEQIKEKNIWKCLYCGAEVERVEQYDGLFTIKNVVRQALLDVAYRRLDSAQMNLVECEKIDSRYVGTIIAKIAYQTIKAITPGALPDTEVRNVFRQLKRDFEALQEIGRNVTGDEEALYEAFDSADIYATLLLVYDSLNDAARRDYVAGLLNAGQVYAKEPNKNLLSYALNNNKFDMLDELMRTPDNVEPGFAFHELLIKYPDNENKIKIIERLLTSQVFTTEEKKSLESYLVQSADSISTKGSLVVLAHSANIRVGLEEVITSLLSKADALTVESVLNQICSVKLNDDDVYKIVDFAAAAKSVDISAAALKALKSTGQYVQITSKYLIAFLSRSDFSVSDKTGVIKILIEFNVDAKSKDSAINHYLCFNQDAADTRMAIIPALLNMVTVIQTGTVESFVLKINADGANKPGVVEMIFALDINMSFVNDLLVKYMNSSPDTAEVRDKIVTILTGKGLKIDPKAFIDYICRPSVSASDKLDFVKKMLQNGTQLRGDTVNAYLEVTPAEQFSPELFALIIDSASSVSEKALTNYLLLCKDKESYKARNFVTLARQCSKNVADIRCDGVFSGQKISGSTLAVYLLATPDSYGVTKEIADYLIGQKAKLNAEIQSSASGAMKLKKFVSANRGKLSAVSEQICAAYKLG